MRIVDPFSRFSPAEFIFLYGSIGAEWTMTHDGPPWEVNGKVFVFDWLTKFDRPHSRRPLIINVSRFWIDSHDPPTPGNCPVLRIVPILNVECHNGYIWPRAVEKHFLTQHDVLP